MDVDLPGLMREAIGLAASRRPHPNPRVGAIVVDAGGRVVARDSHEGPGAAHAERKALATAGEAARGGTLVVTLEPCVHEGRTPPCTDAVLASGVRRVVVGAVDPDPRVAGKGLAILRGAGLDVDSGILAAEVEDLDPGYFHHRRTGRPRVTLKAAVTLDGQTAARDGSSRWITGEEARLDAHRLRSEVDAVVVGAGTVIADDPRLTVRLPDYSGAQPRPVIVAGSRPLPAGASIWEGEPLVLAPRDVPVPAGKVLVFPAAGGGVDLGAGLRALADEGILDVLVEGGAALAASLWEARLVDRGVWYMAGRLAGGSGRSVFARGFATLADSRPVRIVSVGPVGGDLRIEWVS